MRRRYGEPEKKDEKDEDAAEIPVSRDKRDNGLSNYPAKRLNRATMKLVSSFFSFPFRDFSPICTMMIYLMIFSLQKVVWGD